MARPKGNNSIHWILIWLLSLGLNLPLYAHGNEKHVMGTVKRIAAESIVVDTTSHQTETVQISDQTKFIQDGNISNLSRLKVGDRVVVHAKPMGGKLLATEVTFGSRGAGKKSH